MIKITLDKFTRKPEYRDLYTCYMSGSKNVATLSVAKIEGDYVLMDWCLYDWLHGTSLGEIYEVNDERYGI